MRYKKNAIKFKNRAIRKQHDLLDVEPAVDIASRFDLNIALSQHSGQHVSKLKMDNSP